MSRKDQQVGTRPGRVITFYSFKGGVGRTMAVANVATLLAQRGKTVLALDFDFEAPGLHRYFLTQEDKFKRFQPERVQQGVINLFTALRARLQEQWPGADGFAQPATMEAAAAIVREHLDSDTYAYRICLKNPNGKKSPPVAIDFIPAAKFDGTYTSEVRGFDWQEFYNLYAEIFPVVANELGKRYDYVLIDSRTGVSDIASICTMLLPDKLVLVFSPNNQSLSGALDAGWQSVEERKGSTDPRPLPLFPLLSRVDDGEEQLKRKWIADARGAFERLFRKVYDMEQCDLDVYFSQVRIAHRSHYAYGEEIAAEAEAVRETGSLAQAYDRFLECLECDSATDAQTMLERAENDNEQAVLRKLESEGGLQELIRKDPNDPSPRSLYAQFLLARGRAAEAISVYEDIIAQFGDGAGETELEAAVASALFSKAVALGGLNRLVEEQSTYEELLTRFRDATELSIQNLVALAFNNIGFNLLLGAKQAWQRHDEAISRELLSAASVRISEALERNPMNGVAWGNAGYIAFLEGREEDARALLTKAIELGGEDLRKGELSDADIHPLPQDEAFRELVRSIPVKPAAPGTMDAPVGGVPPARIEHGS